jgi:hypothetical protein
MAELRALPPRSHDEDPGCEWCHPNYPCFKAEPKFNRMNCPRVEGVRFLSGEECHYDEKNHVVWDIQAVSFKLDYELVAEADDE